MQNKIHQQEIILPFNTSFLTKMYFEKCNAASSDLYIELEKIEEACWNGLLEEVLPELTAMNPSEKPIFIWAIREYNAMMKIDRGEHPREKDNYFSIDPYQFLTKPPTKSDN